jgi:hypothetical protein
VLGIDNETLFLAHAADLCNDSLDVGHLRLLCYKETRANVVSVLFTDNDCYVSDLSKTWSRPPKISAKRESGVPILLAKFSVESDIFTSISDRRL